MEAERDQVSAFTLSFAGRSSRGIESSAVEPEGGLDWRGDQYRFWVVMRSEFAGLRVLEGDRERCVRSR